MTENPTPADVPAGNTRPLPVLGGKRSNGRADRTGNPQADREVRATKTAAKAAPKAAARKRVAPVAGQDTPTAPVAGRTAAEKNAAARKPRKAAVETAGDHPAEQADAAAVPAARKARVAAEGNPFRVAAMKKARTAATAASALAALHTAALHRNDRISQPPAETVPLAPVSATMNALGAPGDYLRCHGACGLVLPVARFPYVGPKATATGRYLECGADQADRLAVNQDRKAADLPTVARPRATDLPK